MAKAISNKNVLDARFEVADFEGKWLSSFGRPELRGSWIIFGNSGSGKTTFALELCKYLSGFGKAAYDTLEQGLSLSFQTAWKRVAMQEAGSQVIVLDRETIGDLRARLSHRKSPDIIIIDSLTCLVGFNKREYVSLLQAFPNKLFIFIAHERNHIPEPAIAETVRRLSEVKIRVEGYKAFVTTRYENSQRGEGGKDFIIWDKGANEYWTNNL